MKASLPAELEGGLSDSDDSDDVPSDLDDSGEEDSEKDDVEAENEDGKEHEDEDDDDFSLVEASDAEDLLPLDHEVPGGLIEYDGTDSEAGDAEEEEWGGIDGGIQPGNKRKRDGKEDAKGKRKKLRSLPTFASYEDYANMIEDGPEDDV